MPETDRSAGSSSNAGPSRPVEPSRPPRSDPFSPPGVHDLASSLRSPPPNATTSSATLLGMSVRDAAGEGGSSPDASSSRSGTHMSTLHQTNSIPAGENKVKERCLTWCTQREDATAFCRMLCLRRRPLPTWKEEQAAWHSQEYAKLPRLEDLPTVEQRKAAAGRHVDLQLEHIKRGLWFLQPIQRLRHFLEPYSFVYLKGAPDGPLGRYMEELEQDDGYRDFGVISRGTASERKQRADIGFQYLDWEENGSLLYLPLTSLFKPIIDLPENFQRVVGPGIKMMRMYRQSFTDGTQLGLYKQLKQHVESGQVTKTLNDFGEAMERNRQKATERRNELLPGREAPPGSTAARGSAPDPTRKREDPPTPQQDDSSSAEDARQARVKRTLDRAQKAWSREPEDKEEESGKQE